MTDCKREEIWESAKRRKEMNGLSGSMVGDDEPNVGEVFLESELVPDGNAMAGSTKQIDAYAVQDEYQ